LTNGTVAPPTDQRPRGEIRRGLERRPIRRGDTQTFYIEFFELFRVPRQRVASVEHGMNLPERSAAIAIFFGTASFSPSNVCRTQPDARAMAGARSFSGPQGAPAAAAKSKRGRKK
jgi:hypothetical protein